MVCYASRPAKAESRITSYDKTKDKVIWFYDDHKTEERIVVKETGKELLKKIFIHVPEKISAWYDTMDSITTNAKIS